MASFTNFIKHSFGFGPPALSSSNPAYLEEFQPSEGFQGSLASVEKHAQKETRDWKVLFVGGILNEQCHVQANIDALETQTPVKVQMFWNTVYATHRRDREPKADVVNALASEIETYLANGGKLCIVAHSHGAKISLLALQQLRERGVIKKYEENLEVHTYGGVTSIPIDFAEFVGNYVNPDDLPQVIGTKVWHKNNGTEWTFLSGHGHDFINGYDSHAAKIVTAFARKYSHNVEN